MNEDKTNIEQATPQPLQFQAQSPQPQQSQPTSPIQNQVESREPEIPSIFTGSLVLSAISLAAWSFVVIFLLELMSSCVSGGCSGLFLILPIMLALAAGFPAIILLIAAGVKFAMAKRKNMPGIPIMRKRLLISLLLFLLPIALIPLAFLLGSALASLAH